MARTYAADQLRFLKVAVFHYVLGGWTHVFGLAYSWHENESAFSHCCYFGFSTFGSAYWWIFPKEAQSICRQIIGIET